MSGPAVGMPCPVCKVPLVMSERQGVEVDYCPQCRGVWLDRGELDKIIERNAAEAAPPPAPPQQQPYPQSAPPTAWDQRDYRDNRHGGYHKGYPKRRKSFLEELFD